MSENRDNRTCGQCGCEIPSSSRRRKFCSSRCGYLAWHSDRNAWPQPRTECLNCNRLIPPRKNNRGRFKKFCSLDCSHRYRGKTHPRTGTVVVCVECGKDFPLTPARGPRPKYCSRYCQHLHRKPHVAKQNCQCEVCNKSIVKSINARCRCSKKCSTMARKSCGWCGISGWIPIESVCCSYKCGKALDRATNPGYDEKECTECRSVFKPASVISAKCPACKLASKRARYIENKRHRRARIRGVTVEKFKAIEVFERDGWICQLCFEPVDRTKKMPHPKSVALDHVLPISLGGAHSRDNTQCSCRACNTVKSDQINSLFLFNRWLEKLPNADTALSGVDTASDSYAKTLCA